MPVLTVCKKPPVRGWTNILTPTKTRRDSPDYTKRRLRREMNRRITEALRAGGVFPRTAPEPPAYKQEIPEGRSAGVPPGWRGECRLNRALHPVLSPGLLCFIRVVLGRALKPCW